MMRKTKLDAMDMEAAMRADAENSRKLRYMIEEPNTSIDINENDNVKAILKMFSRC